MERQHTGAGAAVTDLILETFRLNGQLLEAGDRLTAPLGLNSARWQVLGAIRAEGQPLNVAQIGRRIGISRQNVQRIANDLERLGFVTFQENPDHKRAKLVVLTPSSLKTLEKLEVIQATWANELASGIGESTLRQTVETLTEIRQRCEAIERAARQPSLPQKRESMARIEELDAGRPRRADGGR
jgi:DNA-binding MarR family transcriptional regulator